MQESLLQFIWQYSLYRADGLRTSAGEPVTVVHPGALNRDSGPDFTGARIRVGSTLLVGAVELHIKASDWKRHNHDADAAYSNIILHVVHTADADATPGVPVLELKSAIPEYVIERYTGLLQTPQPIPCAHQHMAVSELTKQSWLNRVLAGRWEGRLEEWSARLSVLRGDWNTLFYERLAAAFGFKVNNAPFLLLAQSVPLHTLLRHRESLMQLEALLLGQSGLLEAASVDDEYVQRLRREYHFLQAKYNLSPVPAHLWKFLRLRPANFPTVRIAQFAALLHRSDGLFSKLAEATAAEAGKLLNVRASDYWDNHVRFGEAQERSAAKSLGTASVENLLLNVVAPMRFLLAFHNGNAAGRESALQFLEALPAEDNNILRAWAETGWKARNALESQALLELFKNYCTPKRCLECAIGLSILRLKT